MKNLNLIVLLLTSSIIACNTQNELELSVLSNEVIFTKVDNQPTFEGGMTAYYEYIQANLTYPAKAKKDGIEGKVFIEFVITKTGKVESAKILRGLEENCDKAVLALISNSPDWKPGSQKGVPVNVKMVLPITFSLTKQPTIINNTNFENITEVLEFSISDSSMFSAETMPKFIGGQSALFSYIKTNINYPEKSKQAGIEGKVLVAFVIQKDGSVTNVNLIKGIGDKCDQEALKIINGMPKWIPGSTEGKPLDVKIILPITFKLD